MVFHWSLSDSKFPQVSRTLLSILAVFDTAVVWRVFTRPPTSKFFSPFNNPLITEPKAPFMIGIIVTCMFYCLFVFFNSLDCRGTYSSVHILSVLYCGQPVKSTILQILIFVLIIWSGLLAEIRLSVCMSKSHKSLCVPFSRTDAGFCIYHLFV